VETLATTSPPFCKEPHRSHILFVKVAPGTTFTSWTQHHYAIGNSEPQMLKPSQCEVHTVVARNHRGDTLCHVSESFLSSQSTSHSSQRRVRVI